MNIALFTDSYIPTKSGIVTVVTQLRRVLEQQGHHVVVVTVSNGYTDHILEADTNLLRIYAMPTPFGNDQYFGFPNKRKVINFLKEHKIELIHAHTEFSVGQMAVIAGRKLHIPVIATTHTMWEDYYRYYLSVGKIIPKKFVRRIVKNCYKNFYALINVSQKARNYFKLPEVLPKTPSAVIPNAIDTSNFITKNYTLLEKTKLRKQYNIKKNDKVILYVGRIVEEKRILELLEIIKRVVQRQDNIKMLFVGSGNPLEQMKKDVIKSGLEDKIIFTGFIPWEQVSQIYSIGDVFVTTSLSEMHSMTILEALCLGIPVVCRKDTSFADTIFHGENGYECDTDEEMDDYILKICNDNELHNKMSNKALEISLHFSLAIHGIRTEAFYRYILEHFPKRITSESLEKTLRKAEEGL